MEQKNSINSTTCQVIPHSYKIQVAKVASFSAFVNTAVKISILGIMKLFLRSLFSTVCFFSMMETHEKGAPANSYLQRFNDENAEREEKKDFSNSKYV